MTALKTLPELGMPTLIELDGARENARLCAELGLKFVELNMNLPEYADIAAIDRRELSALREAYGVYFTLHLDERTDLCDFNPLVRQAYLETLRRALALAAESGMPVLNLHWSRGVYFTLPDKKVYLYEQKRGAVSQALTALRALVRQEAGENVTLCIENTDHYTDFAAGDVETLLTEEKIGLTLDVGHMAADPDCAKYEAFYEKHIDKLRHMHLHDAKGTKNHLPLGTGERDWRADLKLAAARDCRAVVEVKTAEALRASVEKIRDAEH